LLSIAAAAIIVDVYRLKVPAQKIKREVD